MSFGKDDYSSFVSLLFLPSGAQIAAEIVEELTFAELAVVQSQWRAYEDTVKQGPDSSSWDWMQKRLHVPHQDADIIGVRCEGRIQGLMMLDRTSRLGMTALELLHVRYLQAAPWSRAGRPERQYKGVGTLLLAAAVQKSTDSGCSGALGLTALPSSEPFYLARGFKRVALVGEYPYLELQPNKKEGPHD